MESQVSPKNIEARVEAMAAASAPVVPEVKAPEVKAPETPEVKAPEVKAPEVKAPEVKAPEVKAPEVKAPEVKAPEKKQPNDPSELRKWSTKLSQENAALRDEMKAIKAAIEKMSKKPVDYNALAKDPEGLKKHIEAERAEAVAELQEKYKEANNRALYNETTLAKLEFEKDTENYPRWNKLFPLIQNLAANSDGRIKFNGRPATEVLHDLYVLADQLSPVDAPVVKEEPKVEPKVEAAAPAPKMFTEEEMNARIEAARKDAADKAAAGLSAEANGAGIGSSGKGGRRDAGTSKEAFQKMPLADLKAHIQKQSA